jgi:hypothetical protein
MTEPTTDAVTETPASALVPWGPLLITCDTGGCPSSYQGSWNYASAWQEAVDSRWGTDATGQRRCPTCMDARVPSAGLYVPPAGLAAWIASLSPDPGEALEPAQEPVTDGETAPVLFAVPAAEQAPADPPVPAASAIPANPIAELAAERHLPELPELDPAREKAMAAFNLAHDTEDGPQEPEAAEPAEAEPAEAASADPAETSVMEPPTVIVPAITDEGAQK